MEINLFQSYFIDTDEERQKELDYCLLKNIQNPLISNIYLFTDVSLPYEDKKIKIIKASYRPTYRNFFNAIAQYEPNEKSINIISNLDIYFNETLSRLSFIQEVDVYCLTRWDVQPDGSIKLLNRNDSQDVWIFKGSINDREMNCDFCMGIPGCDNRIAHEFSEAGYRVSNPSRSIQAIHLHLIMKRNYVVGVDKVPSPYKCLRPDYI